MNALRPCVLYARKSTDREDKQILSIPAQLRELREFAQRSGLIIVDELTESFSARKPGRPVFSKLLRDARAGRVQRILAWRLDRLARNPVDGGQLIYFLGEGVLSELVTPEGSYTGAGDSKFMLSVLFGAATKMTDDLSAGVKRGNHEVLKGGRIPGCPPLGYMKVRDTAGYRGAARVVPDPERFPIVQRIWKEVATGAVTVAEAWRHAKEWGLLSRGTRRSAPALPSVTSLYTFLRNPFYAGIIRYAGKDFPGEHPPMISREEFDRVQQFINPTGAPRPSRNLFQYRGLLRCGDCGRLLVGERIAKKSGLIFTYYRCGRRRQGYERCPSLAPTEDRVTADVERHLANLVLPDRIAAWTRDALDWWASEQKGFAVERAAAVRSELATAERNLSRLTDLLVSGVLPERDFVTRREATQVQIDALHRAIAEPEAEFAAWRARVEEAVTAGQQVSLVLANTDLVARRAFIATVYENLVVSDRIAKPSLRFPFTLLEHASEISKVASGRYENRLPPPRTVLSKRKSAHCRNPCERALRAWCSRLEEVRTLLPDASR